MKGDTNQKYAQYPQSEKICKKCSVPNINYGIDSHGECSLVCPLNCKTCSEIKTNQNAFQFDSSQIVKQKEAIAAFKTLTGGGQTSAEGGTAAINNEIKRKD